VTKEQAYLLATRKHILW